MANVINLQPQALDLMLYSGDGFSVKFTCMNSDGTPVDITGSVAAEVRLDRIHPDDPPVLEFSVNLVDSYLGIIILSLTGAQTQSLTDNVNHKFSGVWDVEWDPSVGERRTLCQGAVECVADVTR